MRADMHKVIVERPRWGGGRERHNRRANVPLEDRPTRESMRAAHTDRKSFGENLAPLRRWLRSQVGRPWGDIYSDACSVIKPDSTVRKHIKVHLLEMVERHTFLRNGEVWCFQCGWWNANEVQVAKIGGSWACFYVHPRSGLLWDVWPGRRPPSWREREAQKRAEACRWLNEETALLKLNGCWFECDMRPLPADERMRTYDSASRMLLSRREAERRYGKPVICVGKRQLSRRELKHFGLTNSAFVEA